MPMLVQMVFILFQVYHWIMISAHPPNPLLIFLFTLLIPFLYNNQFPSNSQHLWYLRVAHPNNHTLKLVIFSLAIKTKISTFCNACCIFKVHKLHSPAAQTIYKHPL